MCNAFSVPEIQKKKKCKINSNIIWLVIFKFQNSSCSYNGGEWNKNGKDGDKDEDDEQKNNVAVYPWMTRVHSASGQFNFNFKLIRQWWH